MHTPHADRVTGLQQLARYGKGLANVQRCRFSDTQCYTRRALDLKHSRIFTLYILRALSAYSQPWQDRN
jgi:hypothetical protein